MIIVVYRPPYSVNHPFTIKYFIEEFEDYLTTIITSTSKIIIGGDLNMDDIDPNSTIKLIDMKESFGLENCVNIPTHLAGHFIDSILQGDMIN